VYRTQRRRNRANARPLPFFWLRAVFVAANSELFRGSACEISRPKKERKEVSSEDQMFNSYELLCRSGADRVARAERTAKELRSYPNAEVSTNGPANSAGLPRHIVTKGHGVMAAIVTMEEPATTMTADLSIRILTHTGRTRTLGTTHIRTMRIIPILTHIIASQRRTATTHHWLRRCRLVWQTSATTMA
jgi:hypothetical protein